jgi:hypothetical protein
MGTQFQINPRLNFSFKHKTEYFFLQKFMTVSTTSRINVEPVQAFQNVSCNKNKKC